jgi:hypothetical protein
MHPDKQEEYNKAVIQKMVQACAKFQRIFSGSEGEEVLAMIESQVPKNVFNKDPFVHAHNQGKKELFEFIKNGLDDKKLQKNIEQMKKMCKEKENV